MRGAAAAVAAVVILGAGAVACDRDPGDPAPDIVLDGSPRPPDDEGVVTTISFESLTLDGARTYDVSEHLASFSTYDLSTQRMLSWRDKYVHVGLVDDTVVWIAGVGDVLPGTPATVFYTGFLMERDGDELIFRDGTVLTAGSTVTVPGQLPASVVAEIDPEAHTVRAVRLP